MNLNRSKLTKAFLVVFCVFFVITGCGKKDDSSSKNGNTSKNNGISSDSSSETNNGTSDDGTSSGDAANSGGTDNVNSGIDLGIDFGGDWMSQFGITLDEEELSGKFGVIYPANGDMTFTRTPTFAWEEKEDAESYRLKLEQLVGDSYKTVFTKKNLKDNSFTLEKPLGYGETYRFTVEAVRDDGTSEKPVNLPENGIVFMCMTDAENHPVNKGMDFEFDGGISEAVLRNYLSRSMCNGIFDWHTWESGRDQSYVGDDIRMIFNTGAKYISRAYCMWEPSSDEFEYFEGMKETIDKMHKIDPDLVFEACIFETTTPKVDTIPIPEWVFEAFGLEAEQRNFESAKMMFPDGKYENQWGPGVHCPDIRQLETQMFIYYRAVTFIDLGFEGLHLGQANMLASEDPTNECYTKVIGMIRDYAKTHARRHWVLINAMRGENSFMDPTNTYLLEDFGTWATMPRNAPYDVMHAPTEDNPQQTFINPDDPVCMYNNSQGGITPSGWYIEHQLYKVELDNFMTGDLSNLNIPDITHWPWGMDDISWFANQPGNYRRYWLEYAYNRIHEIDSSAYFEMPGKRIAFIQYPFNPGDGEGKYYYANSKIYSTYGFDDETQIKNVWYKSNPNYK